VCPRRRKAAVLETVGPPPWLACDRLSKSTPDCFEVVATSSGAIPWHRHESPDMEAEIAHEVALSTLKQIPFACAHDGGSRRDLMRLIADMRS
jgi:hypothetical protein